MASTVLYPFRLGSDIGCGIAVFPINLKRAVPEKFAARFPDHPACCAASCAITWAAPSSRPR